MRKLDELEGRMIKQQERASAPARAGVSPTAPAPAKPEYEFSPTANPKP